MNYPGFSVILIWIEQEELPLLFKLA